INRVQETSCIEDQSRRPNYSPIQTSKEIEKRVLKVREENPTWGGRKLRNRLLAIGVKSPPSASTITEILRRHGLLRETDGVGKNFKRFEHDSPNAMWQMDFKGEFALSSKQYCYPLTLLDDHSRFSFCIDARGNQQGQTVRQSLEKTFGQYGMPFAIYVDNGTPWGNNSGIFAHTRVSIWLMRHDIQIIHGRPYHPQGRGKLERFHRTLKQEVLQGRQFGSLSRAQKCFDTWREVYNHDRPHEGLQDQVPSSRYQVSDREFRSKIVPYQYSSRFETRVANRAGEIKFKGKSYRLSEVFIDEQVGLQPGDIDGVWDVFFCRFVVGQLDERTGKIRRASSLSEFRCAPFSQTAGSTTK
ncbi:MAG: integrase core domain-containing protein, partial [Pirellula sp.]